MVEAFPEDTAPRYMIRDRDGIYGADFVRRVKGMGTEEVLTAPRSPWQNSFVERPIGSIRRRGFEEAQLCAMTLCAQLSAYEVGLLIRRARPELSRRLPSSSRGRRLAETSRSRH